MSVRIVTDSTSDIPPHVAQELGIAVVPLSVIFGEESYKEGKEISHDLFYERLTQDKQLPTTSAPSVGDFVETYRKVLDDTDEIVSIHLSSKLSATYENAVQAAAILADEGAKIEVVDSQVISMGLFFLCQAASRAAHEGATTDDIRSLMNDMIPRISVYVALDTLEYVRRGGRIGRARAFLGTVLRVKPILSFQGGEVHPEERVRTRSLAMDRMFQIATAVPSIEEIGVAYSTNAAEAEQMKRRLEEALEGVAVYITRLGPVIGVHGGPGVLGIGILQGK
ncbi:MAG TPA: DegV family protein [Dehalococcoidia bacterium]|nr:DegV family protein [Dehalococcoidia bacterium]